MVCVGVLTLEPCRHHPLLTWLLSRRGQNRSGQGWIGKRLYMGSPVKTKFRHELASKQSLEMDPLCIHLYIQYIYIYIICLILNLPNRVALVPPLFVASIPTPIVPQLQGGPLGIAKFVCNWVNYGWYMFILDITMLIMGIIGFISQFINWGGTTLYISMISPLNEGFSQKLTAFSDAFPSHGCLRPRILRSAWSA